MKTKMKYIVFTAVMWLSLALPGRAQTNTPAPPPPATSLLGIAGFNLDFLTNLPSASGFDTAKFGIGTGIVTKDASVLNYISADAYLKTNWMITLQVQNAPNLIDNVSLAAGYRIVSPSHEAYIQVIGRKTLSTDASGTPSGWQGGLKVGYDFTPMTGGKFQITSGTTILTSPHGNALTKSPPIEFEAGLKFLL